LEGTVDPSSYKEILVILVAAGVIIPVFRKIGISSVLGFLIVGILIGPSVLGNLRRITAGSTPSLSRTARK
jgi:Kef-type K+ transport system membrane component KefB